MNKYKWIRIRATQEDIDRLKALAEAIEGNENAALRAIIRTANKAQVLKGVKRGERRGR
jgi:hypothetical protein